MGRKLSTWNIAITGDDLSRLIAVIQYGIRGEPQRAKIVLVWDAGSTSAPEVVAATGATRMTVGSTLSAWERGGFAATFPDWVRRELIRELQAARCGECGRRYDKATARRKAEETLKLDEVRY